MDVNSVVNNRFYENKNTTLDSAQVDREKDIFLRISHKHGQGGGQGNCDPMT